MMGDFGAMNLSWEIEGEFAGYFWNTEYRGACCLDLYSELFFFPKRKKTIFRRGFCVVVDEEGFDRTGAPAPDPHMLSFSQIAKNPRLSTRVLCSGR
jgi:hypothetical protein